MMLSLLLWACSTTTTLEGESFTVGCGMCMFEKPSTGCYWAAKVDGAVLGVGGPGVPTEEELPSHGPGGMCATEREARIWGTRYPDKIIADRFELVPLHSTPPAEVHDHAH